MLFVCLTKPIMLLNLGMSRPGPLQGLDNLKICPLSYLWCCKPCTHSRQSGHSQSGQCPARLEASSEVCFREDLDPVPPALPGVESHLFCQPRSDGHYRRTENIHKLTYYQRPSECTGNSIIYSIIQITGLPQGSKVKYPPATQETWVRPLRVKIPLD